MVLQDRESKDGWRHGCYITEVFLRESDNTYWTVSYNSSPNGDYHGLREGDYNTHQVKPVTKLVEITSYREV